ncbi:hypothetical protein AKO1_007644 [Acrasis kona]|uniref:Uncharacterized protein n=1 Tax=Acrasis kona TaxID=1008807 RepID=A0AAW2YPU7_9EUKA
MKHLPQSLYTQPLPDVEAGLLLVCNHEVDTTAGPDVQKCIIDRTLLSIKHYRHRTSCYLPVNIIQLLQSNPQYISEAVKCFCSRDSTSMKYTTTMSQFGPLIKHQTHLVTMSRCQYAQLMSQKFSPPKCLSKEYSNHTKDISQDIGLKLSCGFEIMYQEAKNQKHYQEGFKTYVDKLSQLGYFKDEMEGSSLYKQLLENAKNEYSRSTGQVDTVQSKIDQILENNEPIQDQTNIKPDSDDWFVRGQPLHDYFSMKSQQMDEGQQEAKVDQVLKGMHNFLNAESSFEGVEEASMEQMMQKVFGGLDMRDLMDDDDDDDNNFQDEDGNITNMRKYMMAMDQELSGKRTFDEKEQEENSERDEFGDEYVMLKNILKSFKAQGGRTGPASNLLGSMGIDLPVDQDE